MKKLGSVMAVAALVATTATVAFAGAGAGTGINGSMHDINSVAGGYQKDDFQRVCVFCHTPHNALPNGSVPAPLWNHAPSTVQLDPYTWAAPANQVLAIDDPLVGPSRLCMACHDGVTAVDSHGSAGQGNNGNTKMTAGYADPVLGGTATRFISSLQVTHPIGFQYADAVAARNVSGQPAEIASPNDHFLSSVPANTHTRSGGDPALKKIGDVLYSGYFTCASCHDVHNTNNAVNPVAQSGGTAPNYFLWAKETGSIICLSCHIK
jgi:hypothetical protein